MKSFNRIKQINNKEYVYQITPYYDKTTKRIKHKSKYLGIYNGDIDSAIKRKDITVPKEILNYGEFIPFLDIIEKLNLEEILKKITPHYKEILILALNKTINPLPLKSIKSWIEGNILSKKYSKLSISSQNISEILKKISVEEIKGKFICDA